MKTILCLLALLLIPGTGCDRRPTIAPLPPDAVILAFGDSLTYGTGARPEQSYPRLIESLLRRVLINGGVPGETSEEGLRRLPELLREHRPNLVILCHGGNDLLRRGDRARLASNLGKMVELARAEGADVVLVAVPQLSLLGSPPKLYEEIAEEHRLPFEGEILYEILTDRELKSDPIHPNGEGYRKMAEALALLIDEAQAR